MPVTSPIAHRRSPARSCASTGIPWRVGLDADRLQADARRRAGAGRWRRAAGRRAARGRRRARGRSPRPSRRAAVACTPRTSSMPSRRRTSPSASPSGAGSRGEHVLGALDERHLAAEAAHGLRHLDADRPAAEDEQPARDGLHAGHLAVGPDAVELAQARDRRHDRIGAGRERRRARRCGARRRPRPTPVPASRPLPRSRSMPLLGEPALLAGVGVVRDHEVAPGERRLDVDLGASPPPRARACTASPGRSSVFDGMHAQYEHSPPTSSRSTSATRRPPSASAPAQCSPGEPPPMTMTS